jgi:hypothetical protein
VLLSLSGNPVSALKTGFLEQKKPFSKAGTGLQWRFSVRFLVKAVHVQSKNKMFSEMIPQTAANWKLLIMSGVHREIPYWP